MAAQSFLEEVILAFGTADGAIPMRRGDAYMLAREWGDTPREADVFAFSPHCRRAPVGAVPFTLEEARAA